MLREDNLFKVLYWASKEGRIYLVNQLINTDMGFLWSSQHGKISTNLRRDTAGTRILYNLKKSEK